MVLLITYDISNKDRDISRLQQAIKSAGTWWHHLENIWLIETNKPPSYWFKKLAPYLVKGDHVYIVRIYPERSGMLPKSAWKWLQRRNFD